MGWRRALKPLGEVDELVWVLLDANLVATRDGNGLAAYILVEGVVSVVFQRVKMEWRPWRTSNSLRSQQMPNLACRNRYQRS